MSFTPQRELKGCSKSKSFPKRIVISGKFTVAGGLCGHTELA
jgi:hypothetical protein